MAIISYVYRVIGATLQLFTVQPLPIEIFLVLLAFLPVTFIRFVLYVIAGRDIYPIWLQVINDLAMIVAAPAFCLWISFVTPQDCCTKDDLNIFAQAHLLTIVVWWLLGAVAYFYVSYRRGLSSPVVEVVAAWVLLFGVGLNAFIAFQEQEVAVAFSPLIILLLLLALVKQHRQLLPRVLTLAQADTLDAAALPVQEVEQPALKVTGSWQARLIPLLDLPWATKFPALFFVGIPIFILVDTVLLLFGQRPDALILAFTQTYHFHFSEMTHLCEGVSCGGHYLCSVAAKGHHRVVKPFRMGVRGGKPIICNRQLLVANAFEEVIQERFPKLHRHIRRQYDLVGDFIHKDYSPYENKFLCDFIYIMMKPLDWGFRLFLYTFEKDPETRIARQYLPKPY